MKNIQSTLEILLNEFEKDLNLKDSIFKKLNIKIDTPAYNFINSIKNHVSNSDLSKEYILSKFKIVKDKFIINPKTNKKHPMSKLETPLKKLVYGGYISSFSKDNDNTDEFKSIEELELYKFALKKSNDNTYIFDDDAVIISKNICGTIDAESFKKVYVFFSSLNFSKNVDVTPNFLFKKKLHCSCGGKFIESQEKIIECKKCQLKFIKDNLLNFIIETIIDKVLSDKSNFNKFKNEINYKIKSLDETFLLLTKKRFNKTKDYLTFNSSSGFDKNTFKNIIDNINSELDTNKNTCCEYRKRLDYITFLENTLSEKNEEQKDIIEKIYSEIFFYIKSNEEKFNSIFEEIIDDIKVVVNKNEKQAKVILEYRVT